MVLSHDAFTVRMFNNCAIFSPNSSHVTVLKIILPMTSGFVDLLYLGYEEEDEQGLGVKPHCSVVGISH